MTDRMKLYNYFFKFTSSVTHHFPKTGSRFLNSFAGFVYSNPLLIKKKFSVDLSILKAVNGFEKILVASDMNIGDAINVQAAVSALRFFYPLAEIDYVISRKAFHLINGNPEISNVFPVYKGGTYPCIEDYSGIKQILDRNKYDLIFNFCPFFNEKVLFGKNQKVINSSTLASLIVKHENYQTGINHIAYQIFYYLSGLISIIEHKVAPSSFPGIVLTLPKNASYRAKEFLGTCKINSNIPLVMLNPDASSLFTRIPFEIQTFILKELAKLSCTVILGRGISFPGFEEKLLEAVPPELRKRVYVIPDGMSIEEYTALLDFVDVYITGDSGPLHAAAARKFQRDDRSGFRNRTAIFSIFGATPARIYGYDSSSRLYLSANQDAPSRVYVPHSLCRNITCINKMAKTCNIVRCFDSFDGDSFMLDIKNYLKNISMENRV